MLPLSGPIQKTFPRGTTGPPVIVNTIDFESAPSFALPVKFVGNKTL
jgi:hypothetical protein